VFPFISMSASVSSPVVKKRVPVRPSVPEPYRQFGLVRKMTLLFPSPPFTAAVRVGELKVPWKEKLSEVPQLVTCADVHRLNPDCMPTSAVA
jgi:hypothetical protein